MNANGSDTKVATRPPRSLPHAPPGVQRRAAPPGGQRRGAPPGDQRRAGPPSAPRRRPPSPAPPAPQRATDAARGPRSAPRPPFVFLVVGLLSGGLVCLLLLNTVLAAGAFRMTSLEQANATLARQQQVLQQQILYAQSPAAIAKRARKLGMVAVTEPQFLNVKSGRIYGRPAALSRRTGN